MRDLEMTRWRRTTDRIASAWLALATAVLMWGLTIKLVGVPFLVWAVSCFAMNVAPRTALSSASMRRVAAAIAWGIAVSWASHLPARAVPDPPLSAFVREGFELLRSGFPCDVFRIHEPAVAGPIVEVFGGHPVLSLGHPGWFAMVLNSGIWILLGVWLLHTVRDPWLAWVQRVGAVAGIAAVLAGLGYLRDTREPNPGPFRLLCPGAYASPVEAMEAAIGRYPTALDHIELHGVVATDGSPAWFSFEVLDSGLRTDLAPTLADIAVRSGIDASRIAVDSDSLHVTDTSPRELAETCDAMIREHFGVRSDYAVRALWW